VFFTFPFSVTFPSPCSVVCCEVASLLSADTKVETAHRLSYQQTPRYRRRTVSPISRHHGRDGAPSLLSADTTVQTAHQSPVTSRVLN